MEDTVAAFLRELRNYEFYRTNLVGIEKLIAFDEDLLANVHGVDPSRQSGSTIVPWVETDEFKRISDELDRLYRKRDMRIGQIEYIESVLSKIDPDIREACLQIYVKKQTYRRIAMHYDISVNGLYYRIQKELAAVV